MAAPICPCKGCMRRYISCHASCGEYHDWLAVRAEDKAKAQQAKQIDQDYMTFTAERVKRVRKASNEASQERRRQ